MGLWNFWAASAKKQRNGDMFEVRIIRIREESVHISKNLRGEQGVSASKKVTDLLHLPSGESERCDAENDTWSSPPSFMLTLFSTCVSAC